MIHLTIRQILLLKTFKDYDGFNGKINIQKVIFAFQIAELKEFNYKFKTGFYGPFSEGLEQDINYLCEVGFLLEEPYGRIRVKDNLTNKSFFSQFKDFFNMLEGNKILENRIVEMLEEDLQTSDRIELAFSFIYLILYKEIHKKEDLFNAIDRWKPGDFNGEDKEDVWDVLIENNLINENGYLRISLEIKDTPNDILESSIYVDNPDESISNQTIDFIGFDKMLSIFYNNNSYWETLFNKIKNKTECKYWDFKQTLQMWGAQKSTKQINQIDFCKKVAAFANRKGGIIFIGITDRIPRKILGVPDIENKLQSINLILNKWIDYQDDFFHLEEIFIKDSRGIKMRCIALLIAQTRDPVGVKNLDGDFSYPVRLETGLEKAYFSVLAKKKNVVDSTNFNFLNFLNNGD